MLATLKKHEEEKFLVFQEVRGRALLNKHTQNRSTDEPKNIYIYIYIQMQEPMNVERNMYVHESSWLSGWSPGKLNCGISSGMKSLYSQIPKKIRWRDDKMWKVTTICYVLQS